MLIVPVGLRLRGSLPETIDADAVAAAPPRFGSYARTVAFAFLSTLSGTVIAYVCNYMTTYAHTVLHLASDLAFGATMVIGVAGAAGAVAGGWLSDRYGRRPLMIWPMLLATIGIMPGFWLINARPGAPSLYGVTFALRLLLSLAITTALVAVAEALPARIRSGARAIVYALAIWIFGGTTQFVVHG